MTPGVCAVGSVSCFLTQDFVSSLVLPIFYVALDTFSIVNFLPKTYALEHKGLLFPCIFINNAISLLGCQSPFTVFSVVKNKNLKDVPAACRNGLSCLKCLKRCDTVPID